MKAILLCAGYATRLYPATIDEPKSLLRIEGKPLLSLTIKNLANIPELDKIFVVANEKFNEKFLEWGRGEDGRIEIINDGTMSNEERIGGVMDFALALKKAGDDDIFVILGDNYFNFQLRRFADFFKKERKIAIALHDLKDIEKAKRFGVLEIKDGDIIGFEEKPKNPKSSLISTGCYLFPKESLEDVRDYINSDKNKEGIGYMIKDFIEREKNIKGFSFDESWYDLGTFEDYEKIKKEVREMGENGNTGN